MSQIWLYLEKKTIGLLRTKIFELESKVKSYETKIEDSEKTKFTK